jgi:hypothetical protein
LKLIELSLRTIQLNILLETVQSLVGTQKLIHIPDKSGNIIGLPFTEEMLVDIMSHLEQEGESGPHDIRVTIDQMESSELSEVTISLRGRSLTYVVNEADFAPQ